MDSKIKIAFGAISLILGIFIGLHIVSAHNTAPSYTMDGYWWLDDDPSIADAEDNTGYGTGNTAQEIDISGVSKESNTRLRVDVSETLKQDQDLSLSPRLEYQAGSVACDAGGVWTTITTDGSANHWALVDTANITDGVAAATNRITGEGTVFSASAGDLLDQTNPAAGVILSSKSGEWEWNMQATTHATAEATYTFRVTNNGTLMNAYDLTNCPRATIAGATSLTVIVSTDTFSTVVPGGAAVFATSTIDVNTNSASGWNVTLYGNSQGAANTVMDLNDYASVGITDQLEWVAPSATTTHVGATSVQIGSFDNSGDVLAFRMMTASGTASFLAPDWWGDADDYSDNANTLWAGIASSTNVSQIGNSSVNSGGGSALNTALYYLKVSNTQQSGAYAGDLTFTTIVN